MQIRQSQCSLELCANCQSVRLGSADAYLAEESRAENGQHTLWLLSRRQAVTGVAVTQKSLATQSVTAAVSLFTDLAQATASTPIANEISQMSSSGAVSKSARAKYVIRRCPRCVATVVKFKLVICACFVAWGPFTFRPRRKPYARLRLDQWRNCAPRGSVACRHRYSLIFVVSTLV